MEKENILKFTNSIILVSKLLDKIEDKFLARKLYEKISDMISAFISVQRVDITKKINDHAASEASVRSNSPLLVSHNILHRNLINSFDNLLDYLEYLTHIFKSDVTPLLVVQRNLLKLKLHVLKQINIGSHKPEVTERAVLASNIPIRFDEQILKANPKRRTKKFDLKQGSNKEKIMNFVKKFPDVRTKEIIDEFNILSGRTVKRNLRELTDEGFLKKKSEGGAVYYFSVE